MVGIAATIKTNLGNAGGNRALAQNLANYFGHALVGAGHGLLRLLALASLLLERGIKAGGG